MKDVAAIVHRKLKTFMEIALEENSMGRFLYKSLSRTWGAQPRGGGGTGKRKPLGATVLKLGSKTALTSLTQDVMGLFKRSVGN